VVSLLGPDDLIAVADQCVSALTPLADHDWDAPAANTDWTCRHTLEHVCSLSYAPLLALRATTIPKSAFGVYPDMPIDWLLVTAQATAAILAEVARAAPPEVRAYHPAGMADASGCIAMMADELVVHTYDIARGLGADYEPEDLVARAVLDRLFPWWPQAEKAWPALLWANGRGTLRGHAEIGTSWLWHCAPLDEWDGTIPRWDPVTRTRVTN
jgi:uncharacterized protein (TIGR03083 family)